MALNEVHISSLVVHVNPLHLNEVKQKITHLVGAEIYGENEQGKLVVVMETENQGFVTDAIDTINNFAHVLSTSLIFHQIETGLEDEPQHNNNDNQTLDPQPEDEAV